MILFTPFGDSSKMMFNSSGNGAHVVVALPTLPGSGDIALRILQTVGGSNKMHVKFGTSASITASDSDSMPIMAPTPAAEIIGVPSGSTHIAILLSAGTATTLLITVGTVV